MSQQTKSAWKDWTATSARTEWKDAFYAFTNSTEDEAPTDVDSTTSWKDLEWDSKREQAAKQVIAQDVNKLTEEEKELYERNAAQFWDEFYVKHNNNFFKQRNYLPVDYPEVVIASDPEATTRTVIVEFGCGNGSSFYPLIEINKECIPRPIVYGVDFSKAAIDHIRNNERYDPENSAALVVDLVKDEFPEEIRQDKIDIGLLVFVMSAIDPIHMPVVVSKLFNSMKPGGLLIFKDYGQYDMTQLRFVAKKNRKIDESFYVRGDGTRTYFFAIEFVENLFLSAGFLKESLRYDVRELKNRKRKITMYRIWLNGKFRKPIN